MKLPSITSFRFTVCALALAGSAAASAQTAPGAPVVAPMLAPAEVTPHHPAKKMHPPAAKHHRAGKYATPQQHEAAAVAGERHKGVGPGNPRGAQSGNEFERNALRRCEVFKTDDDRRACVERVRQPQLSGSVEGGGVIREYTQTIQVPAGPAQPPMQYNGPPPAHHPHMTQPPVEPIRK